jgi:hypothetical protein
MAGVFHRIIVKRHLAQAITVDQDAEGEVFAPLVELGDLEHQLVALPLQAFDDLLRFGHRQQFLGTDQRS